MHYHNSSSLDDLVVKRCMIAQGSGPGKEESTALL